MVQFDLMPNHCHDNFQNVFLIQFSPKQAESSWHAPRKGKSELNEKVDPQYVGRVALQASVREHGLGLGGMAF